MAKLILYTDYIKPNKQVHIINAVNYIANSNSAEVNGQSHGSNKLSSQRQDRLIAELVDQHPNLKKSFEFKNYSELGTMDSATQLITSAEEVLSEAQMTNLKYVSYIATRPGVEKSLSAEHGLFGRDGDLDISSYREKLRLVEGNVFRHVVAIKKEDALAVGFDDREAWESVLKKEMDAVGKVMNFKPGDMEWVGAFHNSDSHPHVHIMMWSKSDDKAIYLKQAGLEKIKGNFGKHIYSQHYKQYYEYKENFNEGIKIEFENLDYKTNSILKSKTNFNLDKLSRLIPSDYSGRWNYGFMAKEVKSILDDIVKDILTLDENAKFQFEGFIDAELDFLNLYESNKTRDEIRNDFLHPSHDSKKPLHNIVLRKFRESYFGQSKYENERDAITERMPDSDKEVKSFNNLETGDNVFHSKTEKNYKVTDITDDSLYLTGTNSLIPKIVSNTVYGKSYELATLLNNVILGNQFRSVENNQLCKIETFTFVDNEIQSVNLVSDNGNHMEVLPCDFDKYILTGEVDLIPLNDLLLDTSIPMLNLMKSLSSINGRTKNSHSGSRSLVKELEQGAREDNRLVEQKL